MVFHKENSKEIHHTPWRKYFQSPRGCLSVASTSLSTATRITKNKMSTIVQEMIKEKIEDANKYLDLIKSQGGYKMEEQAELKIGIGDKEPERIILKPAKVTIVGAKIEDTPKAKKVVFMVKHPDKENYVKLSSVAQIVKKSVKVTGTWLSLDEDGKLQKGTALANLLTKIGAGNIEEATGKEVETDLDGDYLCFKIY